MGNTSSDSLGHSFKRLRVSEVEQLSHSSPSSISPKRKVVSSTNKNVNDIFSDLINSVNQETPVILCNDTDNSSATAAPTLQSSEIDAKKDCDVILRFKDDHSFATESCTTTVSEKNPENTFASVELSDEEIIMCLRSRKIVSDLSDADMPVCLKHTYANKDS
jgi:hypothetical protein